LHRLDLNVHAILGPPAVNVGAALRKPRFRTLRTVRWNSGTKMTSGNVTHPSL
jgi:hypothetical protein